MNPGAQAGVWIPLDQLLALPLPAEPLACLWRELLRALPPDAAREREALEQALQAHELRRVEALCEAGEIDAGLSRLEALAAGLDPTALAALLHRLMPGLHYRLVREAGPSPAPELMADPLRAEQLWQADRWMRRLEALPCEKAHRQEVMAEQICR